MCMYMCIYMLLYNLYMTDRYLYLHVQYIDIHSTYTYHVYSIHGIHVSIPEYAETQVQGCRHAENIDTI